jgi:membrane-bound ClpP family serine protease
MLFLIFLGILDLTAALSLIFEVKFIAFWLGLVMLIKGIDSLFSSFLSKYFYDWLGFLDFLTGISLFCLFYGIDLPFKLIGILELIKAFYCLIQSF